MIDDTDQKKFLSRWSARKLRSHEAEKAAAPVALSEPDDAEAAEAEAVAAPPPDLPDVETLEANSDFTGFLGDNVPRDIAKLAFRKLWRSDPVLANIDGLNDYDEDFSKVGMVVEVIKSAYQVGKGYVTDEAGEPEEDDPAATADQELPGEIAEEFSSGESVESALDGVDEGDTPIERHPAKT